MCHSIIVANCCNDQQWKVSWAMQDLRFSQRWLWIFPPRDRTLCSPLKVKWRFVPLATCFHSGFLLGVFLDPEDIPSKGRLTFNGLHGVISQNIELSWNSFIIYRQVNLLWVQTGETACTLPLCRQASSVLQPPCGLQANNPSTYRFNLECILNVGF
jgi:hypothetical protein